MKKFSRKVISFLLCLVTLISLMAVPAFAATYPDPETKGDEWHKIIVNPWNKKPSDYSVELSSVRGYKVDSRCAYYLKQMLKACESAGHEPLIISAYRSNATQTRLYNNQVQRCMSWGYSYSAAKKKAATSVAPPGTSEHQTGLAVDIVDMDYQSLVDAQANTNTQKWLMKNSWKYGFILRYPKGTRDITGIIYEPWHYRYVGKTLAKAIYDSGLTLEEYLGAVQPTNVKVSNDKISGKPLLAWDKVDNAAKYQVFRSDSKDGTYKRIFTTKYLRYTDNKAEVGKKYYYRIKALTPYGDVSEPSSKVARTCDLPRPRLSIGNAPGTGKPKISWQPIDGAVKYEIYRAESKTGPFTKIYTTRKTEFVNGGVQPGKAYYYKVKAIAENPNANSALTGYLWRTCDLPRPKLKAAALDENTVDLSWNNIEGAYGYKIYRAQGDGDYGFIGKTTELSFTDSTLIPGETYHYKLVALGDTSASNSAESAICTVLLPMA